jgi:hypothetical protein
MTDIERLALVAAKQPFNKLAVRVFIDEVLAETEDLQARLRAGFSFSDND